MQEIMVVYNRRSKQVSFKWVRKEAIMPASADECPSKQPAIMAFYKNYRRQLESISSREIDEYEGYELYVEKKPDEQCNWNEVYEDDVITCEEINMDGQNLGAIRGQELKINSNEPEVVGMEEEKNSTESPEEIVLDREIKEQDYLDLSEDSTGEGLVKDNETDIKILHKAHHYELETFHSSGDSIETDQLEDQKTNCQPSLIKDSKIQHRSLLAENALDKALIRYFNNPFLLGTNIYSLSEFCVSLDFSSKQLLSIDVDLQAKSQPPNTSLISLISQHFANNSLKEKQKQGRSKQEANDILVELYYILERHDSVEIVKRFKMLEQRLIDRIKVQGRMGNVMVDDSLDSSDDSGSRLKNSPQVSRLIEVLSFLESLREINAQTEARN